MKNLILSTKQMPKCRYCGIIFRGSVFGHFEDQMAMLGHEESCEVKKMQIKALDPVAEHKAKKAKKAVEKKQELKNYGKNNYKS